jgi:uncharacterized protein with HEPN domain
MRHYKLYIGDILEAISKIEKYTKGFSRSKFQKNTLVVDAVIKNLEVIGEASKRIPASIKSQIPAIEWKKIVGLRNILIHEYSGIDRDIIWDIIESKLPELKARLIEIIR